MLQITFFGANMNLVYVFDFQINQFLLTGFRFDFLKEWQNLNQWQNHNQEKVIEVDLNTPRSEEDSKTNFETFQHEVLKNSNIKNVGATFNQFGIKLSRSIYSFKFQESIFFVNTFSDI